MYRKIVYNLERIDVQPFHYLSMGTDINNINNIHLGHTLHACYFKYSVISLLQTAHSVTIMTFAPLGTVNFCDLCSKMEFQ